MSGGTHDSAVASSRTRDGHFSVELAYVKPANGPVDDPARAFVASPEVEAGGKGPVSAHRRDHIV